MRRVDIAAGDVIQADYGPLGTIAVSNHSSNPACATCDESRSQGTD
jgi:hypothetical protein